ncbi:MAG: acyl--CoA ligase [Alphaproteobacteria bacterium]|nr:acyl--CoA ligase [Alphaproteobacteria bacterium]
MNNPYRDLAYGPAIALMASRFADREALVFGGRRWSFADVKAEIDAASARLVAADLSPGDKVAIWLPNRPEFIWYWLGAAQIGMVPVILNTRLKREEAAYQIEQSDSRAVLIPGDGAFRDFAGELLEACPELGQGRAALNGSRFPKLEMILLCEPTRQPLAVGRELAELDRAVGDVRLPPLVEDVRAPGMICYSSGTTALPKGAVLNHAAFRKAWDHGPRFHQAPDDRLYLGVPLFGILASINGVLTFWARGGAVILDERFEAGRAIDNIEREGCTVAYLLPPMLEQIVSHPAFSRDRVARLRTGLVASNNADIQRLAIEKLGMHEVFTSYGMTETSSACTRTFSDDPLEIRLETQGQALPDIEVRIGDVETGAPLPPDAEGEVQVRGYNVMLGYYNKPEETAAAFTADGFFRTGDLARMDAEGRLRFQRRVKDGYKYKGFNVSTLEVEAAILAHPDIRAAAVVGLPDGMNGEVGAAFVIARDAGERIDGAALVEFLRPRLAGYKLPAHVFQVEEFPLTAGTQKVRKFQLREMAMARLATMAEARDD